MCTAICYRSNASYFGRNLDIDCGYGGYGYGSNYYNYYMMAMYASAMSSSSNSKSSIELDKDRYYFATLNGPEAAGARPQLKITFSVPKTAEK